MNKNRILILVAGIVLVVILCCLCIAAGVAGFSIFRLSSPTGLTPLVITVVMQPATPTQALKTPVALASPTRVPVIQTPTRLEATPSPFPEVTGPVSSETLDTLTDTLVPINDLLDLVARLNGKTGISRTVTPPAQDYQTGAARTFWVTNVDTNENFQVDARLEYETEHTYFWIQNGVQFNRQDLEDLTLAFENDMYPLNREFFGSEWTPGVDGDPHLYILYAQDIGSNLAGYFSSADEFPPAAHEYSNAVEMFLLNADNIALDEKFTYGVLAHEFQHMIHWYQDRNESSWLNEGFSELAAFLNDYYESGFDWLYMQDPDIQLNHWPSDPSATTPHYGAGFLFLAYFLDRFGEEATQNLVSDPENGLTSVDEVLAKINEVDPVSKQPIRADELFMDWAITNYVQDSTVADGRYDYTAYDNPNTVTATESYSTCPVSPQSRSVSQYGVDYIRFDCQGSFTIKFHGAAQVDVLPVDAYSGTKMFWSNVGDESDMTLTRTFDFSDQTGPLTLSYWTWYDLEEDYDYLYLAASTDGQSWQILDTPSGTDLDPSGNSYGWGYNGASGSETQPAWIQESVDISQFAGKKVQMRFEYVTDAAVNGEGFLLDDVSLPEIHYFSDFEKDDGGWQAAGWARIDNVLPQTYRLALISYGNQTQVQYLTVDASTTLDIPVQIGAGVDEVVLVVTGTTRFTRQKAQYQFEVQR